VFIFIYEDYYRVGSIQRRSYTHPYKNLAKDIVVRLEMESGCWTMPRLLILTGVVVSAYCGVAW
jgi:hypothetical protein